MANISIDKLLGLLTQTMAWNSNCIRVMMLTCAIIQCQLTF